MNTWFLWLFHAAGMPLGYSWIHALAALVLAALVVVACAALHRMGGGAVAGGVAAALTISLAQGANFAHFSSELVPALLECVVVLLLVRRAMSQGRVSYIELWASLIVGILPWTKLQAVLASSVLGLWILFGAPENTLREPGTQRREHWRRRSLLIALMLLPSVIILAVVHAAGAAREFWWSYVLGNATYVGTTTLASVGWKVLRMLHASPSRLLLGTAGFVAVWWLSGRPGRKSVPRSTRECLSWAIALAAVSLTATLVPRDPFPHYQILLIGPLAIVSGLVLSVWSHSSPVRGVIQRPGFWFAVLLIGLPLTTSAAAIRDARDTRLLRERGAPTPAGEIARLVRVHAPGARSMVVWGWMPAVYVETGIPPATRHAVCHFVIDPGPAREHLRQSFLDDVKRERPDVVVDAVAAGCFLWRWDSSQRLRSYPALADYVRDHYLLATEQALVPGGEPVRVYVSKSFRRVHAPELLRRGDSTPNDRAPGIPIERHTLSGGRTATRPRAGGSP